MILAFLLSFHAHAGWFGPGSSDEALVTAKQIPDAECKGRYMAFEISNASNYTVNAMRISILAKEDGHSTEHDLTDNIPATLDNVMKPRTKRRTCLEIPDESWPGGGSYRITVRVDSVDFAE